MLILGWAVLLVGCAGVARADDGAQIRLEMDSATVSALAESGSVLVGLHAVQSSTQGGQPVAWFVSTVWSLQTQIEWPRQYTAWTARTQSGSSQIVGSATYPIKLGQTLDVTAWTGTGQILDSGTEAAIVINNETTTQFDGGLGIGAVPAPVVEFPLYGGGQLTVAPVESVVLMFSTAPIETGRTIETSSGPAALIAMTGPRTIRFDINTGFTALDAGVIQPIAAGTALAPILIQQPTTAAD